MKASVKFKICVDVMMTAALYACMAYMLVGEETHEWIGSGLALLFVLHNALNRKWYAALLTGRYTPLRAFQTAVNLLCLVGRREPPPLCSARTRSCATTCSTTCSCETSSYSSTQSARSISSS